MTENNKTHHIIDDGITTKKYDISGDEHAFPRRKPGMRQNLSSLYTGLFLLFLLALFSYPVSAQLILTSPPREKPAAGKKQYQPLANLLSTILQQEVVYKHPKNWLYYQRDMRANKYDIVFDGPHFISWRIKRYNHHPVAKLPGRLRFLVIVQRQHHNINTLDDLVNQPVCAIAPPNLATMSIQEQFPNPVLQPRLITAKRGGMNGVFHLFQEGKCVAAIFRDQYFYKKVPEQIKQNSKIIYTSRSYANQGITVSDKINKEQREQITRALTRETPATKAILKRFTPRAKAMIAASKQDYRTEYRLLSEVIFGWQVHEDDEHGDF